MNPSAGIPRPSAKSLPGHAGGQTTSGIDSATVIASNIPMLVTVTALRHSSKWRDLCSLLIDIAVARKSAAPPRSRSSRRNTYLRATQILRDTQQVVTLGAVRHELATQIEAAGRPRRERYKEQTRLDLALAAFELAKSEGLAAVRVPQIAAAVGVSPRTFNNYFASKEQAIAWLAGRHAAGMAAALRARPRDEPLGEALVEAIVGQYYAPQHASLPQHWLRDLRSLVMTEPALYTEYLAAVSYAETDLAEAVAERLGGKDPLGAQVLAAMVTGAERAAVIHWMRTKTGRLPDTVSNAVRQAVAGLDA